MKDKSTISYWINLPEYGDVSILTTDATRVPEKGEVVHISTVLEKMWLKNRFRNLSEKQMKALMRSEESQVVGNFVVVSVKRYLHTRHIPVPSSQVFQIDTGETNMEIPIEVVMENFEVFIEYVK